uniref:Uncharacterized protein n=1 Tax=viral metagenome TaxID=1070528 RepID=A0A6C0JLB9_9ZZZZ
MSSQGPSTMTNALPAGTPILPGTPVDNESTTKAFVIACIDPRYINVIEDYLAAHLGKNGFTYDLFILAGASLGGLNTSGSVCSLASTNWQTTLFDHIQIAISLHNVTQILIFEHLSCGAYLGCSVADTMTQHIAKFKSLQTPINARTWTNYAGTSSPGTTIFSNGIKGYIINDGSTSNAGSLYDIQTSEYLNEYYPVGTVSGARVLVVGCIDPRFSALLTAFLRGYKGVQFTYDLTTFAGASLGINQSYGGYNYSLLSQGTTWGPTFFDHLAVAKSLHNITEVWVFDHLDCGAYKRFLYGDVTNPDNSISDHTTQLVSLQGRIASSSPSLAFKGFVMNTDGTIVKTVDDGRGVIINRYEFTPAQSIRDSSDWTSYKKQSAMYKSTNIASSSDPWFVHGEQFRLDWLNGKNKCSGCAANAFSGTVFP